MQIGEARDGLPYNAYNARAFIIVAAVAVALSLASFFYFFNRGMTNVYGDGVAHVNIARKVVDSPDTSAWQRYMQIGSPWLPLQTVLILPFVGSDSLWRSGAAGSIVSMASFVVAALALFLHAGLLYQKEDERYRTILPVLSSAVLMLNPSALYIQATPMSEPVLMAALALAAYTLQRWVVVQSLGRLAVAALAMTLATLARYEAWPLAALAGLIVLFASRGGTITSLKNGVVFGILVSLGPAYWLWHNWAIYGDALWFFSGPYSARGIYQQSGAALGWAKVFVGNLPASVLLMTSIVAVCAGPLLMIAAFVGFGRIVRTRWRTVIEWSPALLLLVPFLFHTYSLYRGEIQVFPLSAFGLLNVRYGLPHLLAIALFAPAVVPMMRRLGTRNAVAAFCAIVALQYGHQIWEGPSQLAIYQEGYRNGVNAKPARERARFSKLLLETPPGAMILMHVGVLGPVVPRGGLHFSNIIHEGTARWHQVDTAIPDDVMTVIVQEGDPLDQRLKASKPLSDSLTEGFVESGSVENIRMFRRIQTRVKEGSERPSIIRTG